MISQTDKSNTTKSLSTENSSNQEQRIPKKQNEEEKNSKTKIKIDQKIQPHKSNFSKRTTSKFLKKQSPKVLGKSPKEISSRQNSGLDAVEPSYNYPSYSKIQTATTTSQYSSKVLKKIQPKTKTPPATKVKKTPSPIIIENLIGKKVDKSPFIIKDFLTKGAFGSLFSGYHEQTKQLVAIKIESKTSERPQLHLEFGFYHLLGKRRGIPQIYCLGPVGNYTALVMDLLGPNLAQLLEKCGGKFSLRTVIQLAIQLISLISYIHSRGLLYRDTKPENFLLGLENSSRWWMIHVVDLGFCKQWRLNDGRHIPFKHGKPLTGTVRYVSINNHRGYEQSRRDDMESIGYMLIYLFKGQLPWMNINAKTIYEKYAHIGLLKQQTNVETLCNNMPNEFIDFMLHVISLGFEQEPDYNYFGKKFIKLLAERYGLELNDKVYDWTRNHEIKDPILRSF